MDSNATGAILGLTLETESSGIYQSFAEAAEVFIHPMERYVPRPDRHTAYQKLYRKYREIYPLLKHLI